LVLAKVGDVNNLFGSRGAVERTTRLIEHDNHRFTPEPLGILGLAAYRHRAKVVSLSQEQIAEFRLADANCVLASAG